jgi:hypothetical protein
MGSHVFAVEPEILDLMNLKEPHPLTFRTIFI